jgi:four helix bundle protein
MATAFEKLDAWKKSMELTKKIYTLTKKFPESEMMGLTAEIRKAAILIPSKIARGSGDLPIDFRLESYEISYCSIRELEHLIHIAHDLGYLDQKEHEDIINAIVSVRKPLSGLIKYTEKKSITDFQRFKEEMMTTNFEAHDLPENDKY